MNGDWQALLQEASRLRQAGRVGDAIAAYERLLSVRPGLADSWYNLGWLYRQDRRFEDSLAAYARALDLQVSGPEEVHVNRAVILSDHLARPDEAMTELRRALACRPDYVPALLNLGNLMEDRGDRRQARDAYRCALAASRDHPLALARLAGVADAHETPQLIVSLRQRLSDPSLDPADRADLGFALGRLLDQAGDYDAAFSAYADANAANRASGGAHANYDSLTQERLIDRIIDAFPAQPARLTADDEGAPVFILGMFRSGSTLVEQILAAHPRIVAGGELDLIPAIVAQLTPYPESAAILDEGAAGRLAEQYRRALPPHRTDQLVTDKRPDNFLHVGLVKTLFPAAKVVHTRRNPLDNLLSLYFLQLDPRASYAHDLEDAGHWYGQYLRLMDHWRALYAHDIIDVDYDRLVADPRPVIEQLLGFLGLEWNDACINFHKQPGHVKTASVWQVRKPLYRESSGRWRNYASHLGTLVDRFGRSGD